MRAIQFLFAGLALVPIAVAPVVQAQTPAMKAPAAAADAGIYELRIYYPAPGKLEPLNARFRNHTLKLFERHGMRNVAYWNDAPTADMPEGRVIYILAYPDRAAREAAWKAFGSDPQWRAVQAKSEEDGKLVAKVDSIFMTMTDYSPPLAVAK